MLHALGGRHHVLRCPANQLVGEVEVDGDGLIGSVHRLTADLGWRCHHVSRPERALCDQVRVIGGHVTTEIRVLEHVHADVRLSDELHQLGPRVGDSRNENLVEVRDRDVTVAMSHAIHAVVECAALTVDIRLQVSWELPLDDVDGFVSVGDVGVQRPVGLGRH